MIKMQFLPAYDRKEDRPVIILEFTKKVLRDTSKPAAYGQQFTSIPFVLVSTENGAIESVCTKDLTIMWRLVPRIANCEIVRMPFGIIAATYKRGTDNA